MILEHFLPCSLSLFRPVLCYTGEACSQTIYLSLVSTAYHDLAPTVRLSIQAPASRLPVQAPGTQQTILPCSRAVASLTWEKIGSLVCRAQSQQPDSGSGPPNSLFVSDSIRSQVLQWARSSHISCHPGTACRLEVLKGKFWWPMMDSDTQEFVGACSICSRNKTPHQPSSGLFQPLSIPEWPWSHIALDFVTGLPPSQGHIVILTVVDRLSKVDHFIPLAKLPSSKEKADALVHQAFRLHGIPMDIVSDQSPQFVSELWKVFCAAPVATFSLSFGCSFSFFWTHHRLLYKLTLRPVKTSTPTSLKT